MAQLFKEIGRVDAGGFHPDQASPSGIDQFAAAQSGSSCDRIGWQTASSNRSTISSITAFRLEQAYRPTLENHVIARRLGRCWSLNLEDWSQAPRGAGRQHWRDPITYRTQSRDYS